MRDFGSSKPKEHNNHRIKLFPFDNFPADPSVGDFILYKSNSTYGIFFYSPNKTWEKLQSIESTILPMGSDFPTNLIPASLFYNNRAKEEELEETDQLYGLYYISDSREPVRLLDRSHEENNDPHPQYLQVGDAISTLQPLKVVQTNNASMQTKLLMGEFSTLNAFKNPMPIKSGMYKVECVVWTDSVSTTYLMEPNFGVGRSEMSPGILIQHGSMITYTTYIHIEDDTNIVPNMLIRHSPSSVNKPSSMNVLPKSFISFDLMF